MNIVFNKGAKEVLSGFDVDFNSGFLNHVCLLISYRLTSIFVPVSPCKNKAPAADFHRPVTWGLRLTLT